jgi:hypothetical protein
LGKDIIGPGEGITYAIFLIKPQWDTAAGTTVTYRVEILPAFDNGVYQIPLVTLAEDFLGLLLGYFPVVMRPLFHENVPAETDQYLRIYRVIAIMKHIPTGAWH